MVVFQASNAFLFLLLIQMERFRKQKQYREGMCEFASRHFRLQVLVLLFAVGKPATEGHNYRFIIHAENPSLPLSFTLFFLQSKLSANTSQHLIAVTQVITRNKKDLVFLNVFSLSLYPECCFHLNLFFTAVIWSPQPITKRADYVKPKCHGAVKAHYPECKAQAGPGASTLEFHKGSCWLPDQKGHTR